MLLWNQVFSSFPDISSFASLQLLFLKSVDARDRVAEVVHFAVHNHITHAGFNPSIFLFCTIHVVVAKKILAKVGKYLICICAFGIFCGRPDAILMLDHNQEVPKLTFDLGQALVQVN